MSQAVDLGEPLRIRTRLHALLALLLVLLAGATGQVSGQSETFNKLAFEFGEVPTPEPMSPGAFQTFPIELTVRCQADNLFVEPPRIDLRLETSQQHENPPLFTLEPASVVLPFGQGRCAAPDNREHRVQLNVTASVPGDSRAFTKGTVEIVVEHEGTERERSDRFTVETAFAGGYEVDHQSVWQAGRNEMLTMPITIENTGNGHLSIDLKAEHDARLPTGGRFVLPGVWILPSPLDGDPGYRADLPIDYRSTHEGSGPINETITIVIEPASADEPSLSLEPTTITFHIRVEGIYVDAPFAPLLAPLVAALVLVAMARRRALEGLP